MSRTRHANRQTQNSKPRPRVQNRACASQQVPHLLPLSLEVSCIVRICHGFDWELLDDIETVSFKTDHFFWIICEESNMTHSQVKQYLGADAVLTKIHWIAQLFVCFYRVQALLLQFIRANLCGEADSSSLLPHIDKYARARIIDVL